MKPKPAAGLSLPDSVSSVQDLKALTMDVRAYAKWFSHIAIKQRLDLAHDAPPPDMSPAASDVIAGLSAQKPLSAQALDELIIALNDIEASAPRLSITLVAPATNDLKKTLVAWCRANIEPSVLVSFRFNSTLLGGMVIRYGSRIYDWSFRRQVIAGRTKFPVILREVGVHREAAAEAVPHV